MIFTFIIERYVGDNRETKKVSYEAEKIMEAIKQIPKGWDIYTCFNGPFDAKTS